MGGPYESDRRATRCRSVCALDVVNGKERSRGEELVNNIYCRGVQWDIELSLVFGSGTFRCAYPDEEWASDGCATP